MAISEISNQVRKNMNTLGVQLSFEFIQQNVEISWNDIYFGLAQNFLTADNAVKYAEFKLASDDNPSDSLINMLWASKYESIDDYLVDLVNGERPVSDEEVENKFLYLLLKWIYLNRVDTEKAFQDVETVYFDFDRPREIESFVRLFPLKKPVSSKEEAVNNIFIKWKKYLDKKECYYSNT